MEIESEQKQFEVLTEKKVTLFSCFNELVSNDELFSFKIRSVRYSEDIFWKTPNRLIHRQRERQNHIEGEFEKTLIMIKSLLKPKVSRNQTIKSTQERRITKALDMLLDGFYSNTKISKLSRLFISKIKDLEISLRYGLPIKSRNKKFHSITIDRTIEDYFNHHGNQNKVVRNVKTELDAQFNTKISTKYIRTKLKKSGFMFKLGKYKKKNLRIKEKKKRVTISKLISDYLLEEVVIIFFDEVEIRVGREPQGRWIKKSGNFEKKPVPKDYDYSTGIFAYELDSGFIGGNLIHGSTTSAEVEYFVASILKSLNERQKYQDGKFIMFCDNASWHKKALKNLKKNSSNRFKLIFNKPSNPTQNAIENSFSYLKRELERREIDSVEKIAKECWEICSRMKQKTILNIKKNFLRNILKFLSYSHF